MACQARAALARTIDRVECANISLLVDSWAQQLGIAPDDQQEVVEIVCNAAGKLTDRLKALRLPQCRLGPALRGDVSHEGEEPPECSFSVTVDLRRYHDVEYLTRFADKLVLAVAVAAGGDRVAPLLGHRDRRGCGMEAGDVMADHLVPFIAKQFEPAVTDRRQDPFPIASVHRYRRSGVERAIVRLAVLGTPERLFLAAGTPDDRGRGQEKRDGSRQSQHSECQHARKPFDDDVTAIDCADDVERVSGKPAISQGPRDPIDGRRRAVELPELGRPHFVHRDLAEM